MKDLRRIMDGIDIIQFFIDYPDLILPILSGVGIISGLGLIARGLKKLGRIIGIAAIIIGIIGSLFGC